MSQELVMQIFNEAVWLAFKLGVPLLLVGMLVGLIIAICLTLPIIYLG